MIEHEFVFKNTKVRSGGIVTLKTWTMMPDGDTALYVWAPRWEIIPDPEMPVKKLHTSEKWTLAGVNSSGMVAILIPGCGVAGWVFCDKPPTTNRNCYVVA